MPLVALLENLYLSWRIVLTQRPAIFSVSAASGGGALYRGNFQLAACSVAAAATTARQTPSCISAPSLL